MNLCPECGGEFENIGRHWAWKESHRPELTKEQYEIAKGLFMGDGSTLQSGKNARLQATMTNLEYLKYISEKFDCLSSNIIEERTAEETAKMNKRTGFSPNASSKNYKDKYIWLSVVHPEFNKLHNWYSDDGKMFPEEITLSPESLTHWYVCDGHFTKPHNQNNIIIAVSNEKDNEEKIEGIFSRSGLPEPDWWNSSTRHSNNKYDGTQTFSACWGKENTKELFKFMLEGVPGFGYKFPNDIHQI